MEQFEFQSYHEASFDAFCKKVIKTTVADYYRMERQQNYANLPAESSYSRMVESSVSFDQYSLYRKTYIVKNILVEVHNEEIGEALQYIVPKKRSVLLLSYFLEYSDADIARLLNVSAPTVARRKKAALSELKQLIGGTYHAG